MQHGPESKCVASGAKVQSVAARTCRCGHTRHEHYLNGVGGLCHECRCASFEAMPLVACDRCPREDAPHVVAASWSSLLVGREGQSSKSLTLCSECVRTFRLFMLGASIGVDVEQSWKRIIDTTAVGS